VLDGLLDAYWRLWSEPSFDQVGTPAGRSVRG
jgi:hypothetical protein